MLCQIPEKDNAMNGTKIKLLINVLRNNTGITAFPVSDIFLLTS